jgi:CTP synthase (UTP-ammonia lyase)
MVMVSHRHINFELFLLLRYERLQKTCSIALVGKYTKLRDCYASVFKALEHSALAVNHKLNLMVSPGLLF